MSCFRDIEGIITSGSMNIDGHSAIRRTISLSSFFGTEITNIDNILLNSLNVEDSLNLTSDEKIEIVLNYIAKNEHLYKDRIVDLKEQFIYVDNDTNYYSIGYIDKKDLISIMEMFFETDNIDLSTSKFYDSNSFERRKRYRQRRRRCQS